MFHIMMMLTPKFARELNAYNFPVQADDTVKVRTTHPGVAESERKGKMGTVVGVMEMIAVKFEDGTVETFNRDELNLRIPGLDELGKDGPQKDGNEPWKSKPWKPEK